MLKYIRSMILFSILLSGCAARVRPVTEILIEETDFAYAPSDFIVPAGRPVTVTLHNSGLVEHDFVVDNIVVTDVVATDAGSTAEHHMGGAVFDLHVSALPGNTSTITFTALEAGVYQIFCSVPGHKEAGMVGQLTVLDIQ